MKFPCRLFKCPAIKRAALETRINSGILQIGRTIFRAKSSDRSLRSVSGRGKIDKTIYQKFDAEDKRSRFADSNKGTGHSGERQDFFYSFNKELSDTR